MIILVSIPHLRALTVEIAVVKFLKDALSSETVLSSELTGIRKINGGVPVLSRGLGVGFPIT